MNCQKCGHEWTCFFVEGEIFPDEVECPICGTIQTVEGWAQEEPAGDELLIHDKCGLPVELCTCPDARLVYDWKNDVFIDRGPKFK